MVHRDLVWLNGLRGHTLEWEERNGRVAGRGRQEKVWWEEVEEEKSLGQWVKRLL